jgi:hypothetical protein
MTQGVAAEVRANIGTGQNPPGIEKGFEKPPTVVGIKLRAGGEIAARLVADDPTAFIIVADEGSQTRALLDPVEEWTWTVTPLKSGSHKLKIIVAVNLRLSDRSTRQKFITKEASINVTVNRPYVVKTWAEKYGPWILTGITPLAIVTWFLNRRERLRREAEERRKQEEERKRAAEKQIGFKANNNDVPVVAPDGSRKPDDPDDG